MTRLHRLTAAMAAFLLAVALTAASHPGPEASPSRPWGSALAIRVLFRSSATVAFRNQEATAASLLPTTELPQLPSPPQEVRAAGGSAAYDPDAGWHGPLRLA